MTLPLTPPISMSQVYTEFSAPVGTPLSQFYAGGPWVPSSNVTVPTKPPISLLDLLGASHTAGGVIGLAASISPTSVDVYIRFKSGSSNPVTASLTGATGTVTAQWSLQSGDSSISISSVTALTVKFSTIIPVAGEVKYATWKCTLTDSGTGKSGSANINVNFESTP